MATRYLFKSADFEDVCALLREYPKMEDMLQLLHEKEITEQLGLAEYTRFTGNVDGYLTLCGSIAHQLDADCAAEFICFWMENQCSFQELQRLERLISSEPGRDWMSDLSTYSGYVNLLCGRRFRVIDLSAVPHYQEHVLVYAITHSKKHFVCLVDENAALFLKIPRDSIHLC